MDKTERVENFGAKYSNEFEAELDKRYEAYISGKTPAITAKESKKRIRRLLTNMRSTAIKNTIMPEKKGKLAEIKTKATTASVEDFINAIPSEQKREDSFALVEMMKKAAGAEPTMWGSGIIGFGNKRYKSPTSGREVDWFVVGFAPRKANITLYLMGLQGSATAFEKLGKYKTGGGCVYINKLADVDLKVLKGIIAEAVKKNK